MSAVLTSSLPGSAIGFQRGGRPNFSQVLRGPQPFGRMVPTAPISTKRSLPAAPWSLSSTSSACSQFSQEKPSGFADRLRAQYADVEEHDAAPESDITGLPAWPGRRGQAVAAGPPSKECGHQGPLTSSVPRRIRNPGLAEWRRVSSMRNAPATRSIVQHLSRGWVCPSLTCRPTRIVFLPNGRRLQGRHPGIPSTRLEAEIQLLRPRLSLKSANHVLGGQPRPSFGQLHAFGEAA